MTKSFRDYFKLRKGKVYLKPGESAPKGQMTQAGTKGGRYYESSGTSGYKEGKEYKSKYSLPPQKLRETLRSHYSFLAGSPEGKEALFQEMNFQGARLNGYDFRGVSFQNSNLIETDFKGSSLVTANLSNADFSRSDLRKVRLTGANLSGTNFKGADLSGADLRGVLLEKTNFEGADLRGAKISEKDKKMIKEKFPTAKVD